ncbi:hypothetical protein [Streptomyces sp. NPDC001774]
MHGRDHAIAGRPGQRVERRNRHGAPAPAEGERLPAHRVSPDLSEHPDHPRILAVFNEATGPLRARDVCEAPDHEPRPKSIEGTRARLKRLVKLDVLTEIDTGSFTRKQ